MYTRTLFDLVKEKLPWKKVIIIYGARQVGKTTLCKDLMIALGVDNCLYLNCEQKSIKQILESQNMLEIIRLFGGKKNIFLDEAQLVDDIGRVLKIIYDTYPEYQLIATGSSAFDLNNRLSEPLTGRNVKFVMYPLSIRELNTSSNSGELFDQLNNFIRYGSYPGVINQPQKDTIELQGYPSPRQSQKTSSFA
jgi:uncharacterized protein